jgi:hypothetical protein
MIDKFGHRYDTVKIKRNEGFSSLFLIDTGEIVHEVDDYLRHNRQKTPEFIPGSMSGGRYT